MILNIKQITLVVGVIALIAIISFYMRKESPVKTQQQTQQIVDNITNNTINKKDSVEPETAVKQNTNNQQPIAKTPTSLYPNTTGFYSYANSSYNFTIKFPSYVQQRTSFATFHQIGNNWRLYASQANQGSQITSFSIYNVDQGTYTNGKQSYPLFFTAEVRIGVSPNVKECFSKDDGFTDQKVVDVNINGTTWKRFSTSDAAMMKYTQAESYRTIHNNMCFVLEQIKAGSNYRDDTMKTGTSDSALNNYYNTGETIIKTFRFTK